MAKFVKNKLAMLSYNTQEKQLKMPEYGRIIQKMIDHCLTIDDREQRTQCAASIIDAMSLLIPSTEPKAEKERKLWDHLAIMSDFKLDVDFPFETVHAEQFDTKPAPLNYREENFRYRHYGRYIERLIITALTIEDEEARLELEVLIATQMKKLLTAVNPDGAEDERIFNDLLMLSKGEIRLSGKGIVLPDYIVPQVVGKKKKKK